MSDIVPCDGCTLCCHGDAIRLLPGDDPTQYRTEPHDWMEGHLMLAHKENGDCVYLGDSGCTIHFTKPLMCREMDCRNIYKRIGFTKARTMGIVRVWIRGRQLQRGIEAKQ